MSLRARGGKDCRPRCVLNQKLIPVQLGTLHRQGSSTNEHPIHLNNTGLGTAGTQLSTSVAHCCCHRPLPATAPKPPRRPAAPLLVLPAPCTLHQLEPWAAHRLTTTPRFNTTIQNYGTVQHGTALRIYTRRSFTADCKDQLCKHRTVQHSTVLSTTRQSCPTHRKDQLSKHNASLHSGLTAQRTRP